MEITDSKWESTCNRFVAFFDIMGFKEMALRNSHEDMLNKLSMIKYFKENIIEGEQYTKHLEHRENLKAFVFSDTIIAFTKSESAEDADILLTKCGHFIRMCIINKLPLKGVISHGKITIGWNDSMFYGQPIIDAFLLQEELQMYGAILDFNAEKKFKELSTERELWDKIALYKTPTKGGRINHYCLKWAGKQTKERDFPGKQNRDYVEDIYTIVSGKPRVYVDNTLEFLDYLINEEKKNEV
jgi:hypothetical protein